MSTSKILLPLSLALVGTVVGIIESAKAQGLPTPIVTNCDETAQIGESNACHGAGAVLFLPESSAFTSGFPASSSELQLADVAVTSSRSGQYQNSNIFFNGPVAFAGEGMAQVTAGSQVELRNSCQLSVTGPAGFGFSFSQTAITCGGAFQDEVIMTMED